MARKRRPALRGHCAQRRTVDLIRGAHVLFVEAVKSDIGPEERKLRQGGLVEGLRAAENGAAVNGAWAVAAGQFEVFEQRGWFGQGNLRSLRSKAADVFRKVAERARVRDGSLCSGYLQRPAGSGGVNLDAEELQQRAVHRLRTWKRGLGARAHNALLDLLVMERPVSRARIALSAVALDWLAAKMLLEA